MKAFLVTGLAALTLAGCNSLPQMPQKHQPHQSQHTHKQDKAATVFVCDNDAMPIIRHLSNNRIEFIVDGETTVMTAERSGSGESYVSSTGIYGKGGKWHQKGDMAVFTYYDVGSPATCKMK